jgi:hypothetical protein
MLHPDVFAAFRFPHLLVHPSLLEYPVVSMLIFGGVFLLFLTPPLRRPREALEALLFESAGGKFRFFLFASAGTAFAMASLLLFDGLPRLTDSISALFQAKIFLRGALSLPLPPEEGFFLFPGMLSFKAGVGRWSSMYPPGWPALLAPAAALGVPWLLNPLLGGLLAVSVSLLGEELYGSRVGRIAGLFTILSPFVTVISATHLSHTATALFCCLAFWATLRMVRRGNVKWGMIAGLSWGTAFLCRPLTALVLGIVFSLGLLPSWRSLLRHWRSTALALLLCGAAVLLLAAYQHAITGDPLTPGHKIGLGRFGTLGFGPIDDRISHTPRYGAEHTLLRIESVGARLLGWPISALLLCAASFLPGRSRREDWWLLAAPLSLLTVFATFHYYEVFFPGRYLFASVPMLLILAARGWTSIADLLRRAGPALPGAAAAACITFGAAVSSPAYFSGYGQDFGDVESLLPRVVEAYDIDNAVVFMDSPGECSSENFWNQDYYGTGFLRNSIDLDGEIVYARSSREKSRRLMDRYPGRSYYLYRYLRCDERVRLYRLTPEGDSFSAQPMPSLIPEVETH